MKFLCNVTTPESQSITRNIAYDYIKEHLVIIDA